MADDEHEKENETKHVDTKPADPGQVKSPPKAGG
jgi:hypothetical protein